MPSSIAAGQPLSEVTFSFPSGPGGAFTLYNVSAGAEEGPRPTFANNMPPGNLSYLIPQTNAIYTVRLYDNLSGGNVLFESSQISVAAPPGLLPARPTPTSSSSLTLTWTATGTSYRVLGREGVGYPYGGLVDTIVSTNSYNFAAAPSGSNPRAIIIPQNANGYGPPSVQMLTASVP